MTVPEETQIEIPEKPPVDLPPCFEEGDKDEIAKYLYAAHFWSGLEEAERNARRVAAETKTVFDFNAFQQDQAVKARVQAQATMRAAIAADVIHTGAKDAFDELVYKIKVGEYYRVDRGEYSTLEAWLADHIPSLKEQSSERSDSLFLYNVVVPTIKSLGNGTAAKLDILPQFWPRTRACLPNLRDAHDRLVDVDKAYTKEIDKIDQSIRKMAAEVSTITDPVKKKALIQEIQKTAILKREKEDEKQCANEANTLEFKRRFIRAVEVIQDLSIPTNGPNGIRKILPKPTNELTIFPGSKCYVKTKDDAGNDVLKAAFTFIVPTDYETAAESMLRNFINISLRDGRDMVAELGKLVMPRGGNKSKNKNKKKKG